MAITTSDDKLAIMEWDNIWEPGIPMLPNTPFDQGNKQQLLWGYPGVLWPTPILAAIVCSLVSINSLTLSSVTLNSLTISEFTLEVCQ